MWKQSLMKELAVVVVLKLVVLTLIWHAFFAQPDRQEVTDQVIGNFILGDSRDIAHSPFNRIETQE